MYIYIYIYIDIDTYKKGHMKDRYWSFAHPKVD